jgi:hypothetical protein
VLLIAANHSRKLIDVVYAKGIFRDKAWVEFARWNALSRVEVDRQGQAKAIVIDADASTYIMNCRPRAVAGLGVADNLMSAPSGAGQRSAPARGVRHHWTGRRGRCASRRGQRQPQRNWHRNQSHHCRYRDARALRRLFAIILYQRPEVHIHVTDGRSFLRSTPQRFDVVQMTLVDTWASTAAGAFALSENNLYTVEAFREYFEHLKPDGMIAITRWEFRQPREALRVVSVAMQALHEPGRRQSSAEFHRSFARRFDEDGIPVVVLAKKTAFTAEEEAAGAGSPGRTCGTQLSGAVHAFDPVKKSIRRSDREQRSLPLRAELCLQCGSGQR